MSKCDSFRYSERVRSGGVYNTEYQIGTSLIATVTSLLILSLGFLLVLEPIAATIQELSGLSSGSNTANGLENTSIYGLHCREDTLQVNWECSSSKVQHITPVTASLDLNILLITSAQLYFSAFRSLWAAAAVDPQTGRCWLLWSTGSDEGWAAVSSSDVVLYIYFFCIYRIGLVVSINPNWYPSLSGYIIKAYFSPWLDVPQEQNWWSKL